MTSGLRERKKRRTRETIVREALRLFSERGFDGVTIADIAEAAGIAPRTYFSYFPTKEDVVFDDHDDTVAGLERRIAEREPDETTLDAMRAWLADLLMDFDPADPVVRCRKELIRSTPALEARQLVGLGEFEALLRAGVADDLGDSPDDLRPRLVAAAATATLMAMSEGGEDLGDLLADRPAMDYVDEALAFLRGGMDAIAGRPRIA